MSRTLAIITLATLFAATSATAAEPTRGSIKPAVTPVAAAGAPAKNGAVSQQDKMRLCSQQATGKKGQERKAFMKGCLSKKA
jgi:hypothetical protein